MIRGAILCLLALRAVDKRCPKQALQFLTWNLFLSELIFWECLDLSIKITPSKLRHLRLAAAPVDVGANDFVQATTKKRFSCNDYVACLENSGAC